MMVTAMESKQSTAGYIRNFLFGAEDSLVSTVGLLSGVAIAGVSSANIILTGMVLIFVEAFSMAVGSFNSEYTAEEYVAQKTVPKKYSITEGIIMFFSYFIFGFIPLGPYVFFSSSEALIYSATLSMIALFAVGYYGARVSGVNTFRGGMRTFLTGGIAIVLGLLVGVWLS
jgi:VIT1/CCC1 family predicted Fe2+/Mn2+ transporter